MVVVGALVVGAVVGAEPAPLETAAFRKLLADEGKMLSALIKERHIVVE